ncbi:acyltransferase [Psychrobium sp. 1_MG-2023]|uniref:acyltransferase n=1 Tax=Psychrobium sp. 1_MG-2023 TaxID=3062624 RepID=UPI000C32738C|nr:acyltransferase [Psychrobium sp. 1_MG-2023]MDP2562626.1 acyltransferase [Psychrobium sp. 1_MG-2023]PKF54382.1 acyltransferase [Alteromonadales bacterium alter-6D02]
MRLINGILSAVFYVLNTIFWVLPILGLALLKLLPIAGWQRCMSYLLDGCASCWIKINGINQALFSRTKVNVLNMPQLSEEQWYLVIANHQSWVDILVLQRVLNGKIPFLKFFLKQQLIYVPIIGLAWWALDFPFMKRYSKDFLAKNPHLKGKDVETTKASCQKFKLKPVSVMNFVEGTRFTPKKWQQQQSPHANLLKPKAGGVAFALNAMSGAIDNMVDVTIFYPGGIPTFWQFISGQVSQVVVDVETAKIDAGLIGDYENDPEFKQSFQQWVNQCWDAKQQRLEQIKTQVT